MMTQPQRRSGAPLCLAMALSLGGCCSSSSVPTCIPPRADMAAPPADLQSPPPGDLAGCRQDKLRFTQATGCQNDGSVEFCLPQGDAALLARAKAIAADLACAPGGGRARCDSTRELLCMLPTSGDRCTAARGALTDAAFAQVCALAALPEVREIVPTWFE